MADRRRAWARALFEAAPDRERRAAYGAALDGLATIFAAERRVRDLLRDPAVGGEEKKDFLAAALPRKSGQMAVDPVFQRFCALLVDKRRTDLVPAIAAVYRGIADAEVGLVRLQVESARPTEEAVLERIAGAWKKYSGSASAVISQKLNTGLIAGYRLRAGSIRMDYSVAGRLERIRRELARPLAQKPADGAGRGEG